MAKLLILQGLPGSGKSYTAAQLTGQFRDWIEVNKDNIRAELEKTGWKWSQEAENRDVIPARNKQIRTALKAGLNVVSSDTNLAPKHLKSIEDLGLEFNAQIEVRLLDTPIDVCIERDQKREKPVGEKVIRDMHSRYGSILHKDHPIYTPYKAPEGAEKAIISDIDGTAAIHNRNPYDFKKLGTDSPDRAVLDILGVYAQESLAKIIYCTGRHEEYREPTVAWLKEHGFPEGLLFMRPNNDYRKDEVVKLELFDKHIREKYDVLFVLDDRDRVVDMWRQIGLKCLQVNYGNF